MPWCSRLTDPLAPVYRGRLGDGVGGALLTNYPNSVTLDTDGIRAYVTVQTQNRLEIISTHPNTEVATCANDPLDAFTPRLDVNICAATPNCPNPYTISTDGGQCVDQLPSPDAQAGAAVPIPAKKFFFFNDVNEDVIGAQLFLNPSYLVAGIPRLSARQWYDHYFEGVEDFRDVPIDGYDAITDGTNYYVNFLNQRDTTDDVSNYILHISINDSAQANTQQIFDKLIDSLAFNINLTDFGYCAAGNERRDIDNPATDVTVVCATDFDCLGVGSDVNQPADRICANARTKMLRDWTRLF